MRIGVGICGSFCTFSQVLPMLEHLCRENRVTPVLSYAAAQYDTRFYRAEEFRAELVRITGEQPIDSIVDAEPIGPKHLFDVMLIAPCTGNTLAKLNLGIVDTPVLMAAKAHLRNGAPLVIAPSTNDALSNAAANIGMLMNKKNIYFVPFSQDDPDKKPRSMVARFGLCAKAVEYAMQGRQIQPMIM